MVRRPNEDIEAGGGGGLDESTRAEGCEYCRGPEPIVCEGFCVHCGTEVRAAHRPSGPSTLPGARADTGAITNELAYIERLRISWFLLWRFLCTFIAIAAVTWFAFPPSDPTPQTFPFRLLFGIAAALVLGILAVAPWLIGIVLKHRFGGFYLAAAREREDSSPK